MKWKTFLTNVLLKKDENNLYVVCVALSWQVPHVQKCINTVYMACRQSSVLLAVMQSLGMTELRITENSKKKINVNGKIVKIFPD